MKDQLQSLTASSTSVKGCLQWQTVEQPTTSATVQGAT